VTTALVDSYRPLGAAARLFTERGPEVVLSGPAGTGKSLACLRKMHLMMLANPGARGLMLRKTATSLTSTALVTFRAHVAKAAIGAGDCRWHGSTDHSTAGFTYANGSELVIGGMDKSTRIMSSEYDVAYVQEATELTPDDWEAITTRLRNGAMSFQQLIADCNPDIPTHWLKVRADEGQTLMIESRHADNPTLIDPDTGEETVKGKAYLDKLRALTGIRRARLCDGKWSAAEGVIYEGWDPAIHLVDAFPDGRRKPPASWQVFWSVDFGFTNPFVLQRWAEDPDGRLWLYAEQYRTKRLVEDHARDALCAVAPPSAGGKWLEPKPQTIICDHDAEDRATLTRHLGLPTQAAHKSVSDGIQAVASRLKVAGDGRPRLFVLRDITHQRDTELRDARLPMGTQEEFPGYTWESGTKDRPLKCDDHGMDALRYVVAARDLVGGYRYRSL